MRLRSVLGNRNPTLLKEVEQLVDRATPMLLHSYGTFSSGTSHTSEHTHRVEKIAGQLLPDTLLSEFTDYEIGLLILACHFHDLGMVGTEADNETQESRDRVRQEHAVSIGDRIRKDWSGLGFPNETMADILSLICKGHRPKRVNGVATWENLPEFRILGPDKDVRVRLVSSVVYAADELHIGEDRATKREEDYLEIKSETSRPHWRRHQAIQGPVNRGDLLCFEGTVSSTIFEKDLRHSLAKAFGAVHEMNSQMAKNGLTRRANGIGFVWNRSDVWTSLIGTVCSDLQPRLNLDIAKEVEAMFRDSMTECADISGLCKEEDSNDARMQQIANSLEHLCTRQFLSGDTKTLQLNSSSRTARYLFELARKADEIESHCDDADRSMHEYRLYESAFGQRYVREHLKPTLEQRFAVDLSSTSSGKHLSNVLENSPTAARILQLAKPPESPMVQTDLFMFACVAGLFSDLVNVPEKILEVSYRQSVDALCQAAASRLPEFLLFLKELAIIRELTHEQVCEAAAAHVTPPESKAIKLDSVTINVSQSFPVNRPEWSMGHLLLARSRANTSISIRNSAFASLKVRVDGESSIPKDAEPVSIGVGPGVPTPAQTGSFRGALVEDAMTQSIRIEFGKLEYEETKRPVLLQFSPTVGNTLTSIGSASCRFSIVHSDLTVNDVLLLSRLKSNKDWRCEAYLLGKPLITKNSIEFGIERVDKDVSILHGIDPQFPLPLHILNEHSSRIEKAQDSDVKEIVATIVDEISASKPIFTSFFLRFATIDGEDYYEEYLGWIPKTINVTSVTFDETESTQSIEFEKARSGEIEYKVETTFREGFAELAEEIRIWTKDPSQSFPWRLNHDQKHEFYYGTTRASMTFHRVVDRTWHFERRVVFGFRPVTKSERYELEMEYWNSKGDGPRAALLSELFQCSLLEEERGKEARLRQE